MRELEVGDRVWIRDDLKDNKFYGIDKWNDSMIKGCQVTIEKLRSNSFIINEDGEFWSYTYEMIDWDKTDNITTVIDPNIIKYKEIFDELLEVGFKRDEALKIMLNVGNVGKNT